jgi:adhesin HecA-like repeat protein
VEAPFFCRPAGVNFFAQHVEPVDVSFGGLRIYCDEEYPVGALVRLDVFTPRKPPASFTGEVMWIKAAARGAPARYDVGLAFVDLNPDALALLRPLLGGEDSRASAEPERRGEAPVDSSVALISDEPVSEVRPVAAPATMGQGQGAGWMHSKIPVVAVTNERLRSEKLDNRAGFLISRIDGVTSVKDLLPLSGMTQEETLAVLAHLERLGIVVLRGRGPDES